MIDWPRLIGDSVWIFSLALMLAAYGLAYYRAREEGAGLRHILHMPGLQRVFNAGLTLFCVGMLATSHALWEQVAWGLLAVVFWVWALTAGQRRRSAKETDTGAEGSQK